MSRLGRIREASNGWDRAVLNWGEVSEFLNEVDRHFTGRATGRHIPINIPGEKIFGALFLLASLAFAVGGAAVWNAGLRATIAYQLVGYSLICLATFCLTVRQFLRFDLQEVVIQRPLKKKVYGYLRIVEVRWTLVGRHRFSVSGVSIIFDDGSYMHAPLSSSVAAGLGHGLRVVVDAGNPEPGVVFDAGRMVNLTGRWGIGTLVGVTEGMARACRFDQFGVSECDDVDV